MGKILLGYRKGVNKKTNAPYCQFWVTSDFSAREKENGCVGEKCDMFFMPDGQIDVFNPSHIGKELQLDLTLSGNRAYLDHVSVVNK